MNVGEVLLLKHVLAMFKCKDTLNALYATLYIFFKQHFNTQHDLSILSQITSIQIGVKARSYEVDDLRKVDIESFQNGC